MAKAVWKDISGYEGLYQVSTAGQVRSLNFIRQGYTKILAMTIDSTGYPVVNLYKNSKRNHVHIHRLVAQTFIPNPENKPQVNHKNGIRHDNNVENLEYCTNSENNKHAFDTLGRKPTWLGKTGKDNASSKQVIRIDLETGETKKYDSMTQTEEDGFSFKCVSNCCRGKSKTHKGYRWEYGKN